MLQRIEEHDYQIVHVTGVNPGAGAQFNSPVGDASRRLLVHVTFALQNSAVVANRLPYIFFLPSGLTAREVAFAPANMTAALRGQFIFTIGAVASAATTGGALGVSQQAHLPARFWLNPADQWGIDVRNMDVGDAIESVQYTFLKQILPIF